MSTRPTPPPSATASGRRSGCWAATSTTGCNGVTQPSVDRVAAGGVRAEVDWVTVEQRQ
ncbi:hypothetical protein [Streptomyces litchfieldiae]|uniref:Uncharacterized protein n=1 Tax=Streptomyces litchfieldiae TaxID=3075543 RepID=A0ABU2MPC5_9ACTN|nr:hypothetical protein [Streptomyces sp. DSM 44938]MDT0343472.1 hypothetical protein [Streptomyces sp. DSM 44938]